MTADELRTLTAVQCGPETAKRIREAFAELEKDKANAERERDLLQRIVIALSEPARPARQSERDAAAVLSCYFALRRLAVLLHAVATGGLKYDLLAQSKRVIVDTVHNSGWWLRNALSNGPHSGELHEFFRLAAALADVAAADNSQLRQPEGEGGK